MDAESQTYHYGSRNYDFATARWNRQDDYRGSINNPASRHRYGFVENNPVNNVDLYGYYSCGAGFQGAPCLMAPQQTPYSVAKNIAQGNINSFEASRNAFETNFNNLVSNAGAKLNALSADVSNARWASYNAMVNHYDYVVMRIIIGRVQERGYDWDYNKVSSYIGNKVVETGYTYSYLSQKYSEAQTTYNKASKQYNLIVNMKDKAFTSLSYTSNSLSDVLAQVSGLESLAKSNPSLAYEKITNMLNNGENKQLVNVLDQAVLKFYGDKQVPGGFSLINVNNNLEYSLLAITNEHRINRTLEAYTSMDEYFQMRQIMNPSLPPAMTLEDFGLIIASIAYEPADWAVMLEDFSKGDIHWYDSLALLPFIPKSLTRKLDDGVDLLKGVYRAEDLSDATRGVEAITKISTDDGLKWLEKGNSQEGLLHILERHVDNYPATLTKGSLFPTNNVEDIQNTIMHIVSDESSFQYINDGNIIYEKTVQFTNNTWSNVRVVTSLDGKIITSYPIPK